MKKIAKNSQKCFLPKVRARMEWNAALAKKEQRPCYLTSRLAFKMMSFAYQLAESRGEMNLEKNN
jgi:hypothetical protein